MILAAVFPLWYIRGVHDDRLTFITSSVYVCGSSIGLPCTSFSESRSQQKNSYNNWKSFCMIRSSRISQLYDAIFWSRAPRSPPGSTEWGSPSRLVTGDAFKHIRGFMKRVYRRLSMMELHRDSMMVCVMPPKGALLSR